MLVLARLRRISIGIARATDFPMISLDVFRASLSIRKKAVTFLERWTAVARGGEIRFPAEIESSFLKLRNCGQPSVVLHCALPGAPSPGRRPARTAASGGPYPGRASYALDAAGSALHPALRRRRSCPEGTRLRTGRRHGSALHLNRTETMLRSLFQTVYRYRRSIIYRIITLPEGKEVITYGNLLYADSRYRKIRKRRRPIGCRVRSISGSAKIQRPRDRKNV